MVFSSLLFLCNFLPICLGLYYIVNNRTYRNWILIISSLFFYAWGEPVWILLLLVSTFISYFFALMVENHSKTSKGKAFMALGITLNILVLSFFKYSGFLVDNINLITGANIQLSKIALPIGISFYTFKIITYLVDVYRGEAEAQKSPFKLLLYVSIFHQVMSGPITRYKDIAEQLDNRVENLKDFNYGVSRFIIGLGKKVILSGLAAKTGEAFIGVDYSRLPVLGAWFGIFMYSMQLYFDFSGYSDMAIGLGRMFGFKYEENFNYPYISKSATEFWRRWHISLGSFFREYVYIPLGGNRRHHFRNLLIVWALTGLWHGASWNFVLWGLYYFVLIFIEKTFLLKLFEKIPTFISRIYLAVAVLVGWVFFYHTDMSQGAEFLGIMFGLKNHALSSPELSIYFWNNAIFIIIALIACTPIAKYITNKAKERKSKFFVLLRRYGMPILNVIVLIISVIYLVGQSYSPFMYFKF
ncbi:MAG: MBOAT family O-acyltransferase [Acetivibrionales bacterium]|nr:MBOAT family protein [Clostridiaceae bacterium]